MSVPESVREHNALSNAVNGNTYSVSESYIIRIIRNNVDNAIILPGRVLKYKYRNSLFGDIELCRVIYIYELFCSASFN